MKTRVSMAGCQRTLATLWFGWCGALVVLMLAFTGVGKFGDQLARAWSWFLPTFMPTLLVIVGVLVHQNQQPGPAATVDRFLFRLSLGLSVFYLLLVLGVLLLQPLSGMTSLELMDTSGLWIGPTQGLVAAALGAFFASREPETGPASGQGVKQ